MPCAGRCAILRGEAVIYFTLFNTCRRTIGPELTERRWPYNTRARKYIRINIIYLVYSVWLMGLSFHVRERPIRGVRRRCPAHTVSWLNDYLYSVRYTRLRVHDPRVSLPPGWRRYSHVFSKTFLTYDFMFIQYTIVFRIRSTSSNE